MTRLLLPLLRDRRGVAAVEFALVCSLLLIMLGGITDFGLALRDKSRLANAVAQGVQYAYLHASSVTTGQIQSVVQGSSSLSGVTATVTGPACYCITGTTPTLSSAACAPTPTCADGTAPGTYVVISATYPFSAILPGFSRMAGTTTITEAATVRIQ
jgi:Flp pilus assembly protein TadG